MFTVVKLSLLGKGCTKELVHLCSLVVLWTTSLTSLLPIGLTLQSYRRTRNEYLVVLVLFMDWCNQCDKCRPPVYLYFFDPGGNIKFKINLEICVFTLLLFQYFLTCSAALFLHVFHSFEVGVNWS